MKIKHRLSLLVAAFVLAFATFGLLAFDTLNALKVNGPYYRQIVLGKDLVADILPPPEYVLEAYLVAHQMADPANRTFLAGLTAKSESLRRDYDDRHKFWVENLPASTESDRRIKHAMAEDSYQPALRFLDTIHDKLVPAVQRGDYQSAASLLHGPLQKDYEEHRAAIDQVVVLTNTNNQVIEANAARIIVARLVALAALGIAIIAGTAIGISRFLERALADRLAEKADALSHPPSDASPDAADQRHADRTRDLTEIVGDLANQTSTLALNTALEAARNALAIRNGEAALSLLESQDRGFGLVAAEFRNLADENASLSRQISRLVEHLQSTIPAAHSGVN